MPRIPMNFDNVPTLEDLKKVVSPGNYNCQATAAGVTVDDNNTVFSEVRWTVQDEGEFNGKEIRIRYYLGDGVLDGDGTLIAIDKGQSDWGAAALKEALKACEVSIDPERGPDTDDLLGKTCNCLVTVGTGDTGRDFNRIEAYIPVA